MERIAAANKSPADFEGCTATVEELDLCEATELPAKIPPEWRIRTKADVKRTRHGAHH